MASIDEEITKLVTDGLTQKELDDSRRFLIHAMPRALETNAGIANYLQTAEFFDLGLDFDVRIPDLLRAVTLDRGQRGCEEVHGRRSRHGRHCRSGERWSVIGGRWSVIGGRRSVIGGWRGLMATTEERGVGEA